MKKAIILFAIIIYPTLLFAQKQSYKFWQELTNDVYSWKPIGEVGFSTGCADLLRFCLSPKNEPFVAYSDSLGQGRLSVQKYNEFGWSFVGDSNFSDPYLDCLDLAFSSNGDVYVAFSYISLVDGKGRLQIQKYNGLDWVEVGETKVLNNGFKGVHLIISPSDEPYVSYVEFDSFLFGMVVEKFDGSKWDEVGTPGFAFPNVDVIDFKFSPAGTPYLAFQDRSDYIPFGISLMKFDGNNWILVGDSCFSKGSPNWVSLTFDSGGVPYVSFDDTSEDYKLTTMYFDGEKWKYFGERGISKGYLSYPSTGFDRDGDLLVAYVDISNGIGLSTVLKFIGNKWTQMGEVSEMHDSFDRYMNLNIRKDGIPYVAYADGSMKHKATVKKFDSVYYEINDRTPQTLYIYPNPTVREINIELPWSSKLGYRLEILDLMGRIMNQFSCRNSSIRVNVEKYPAGFYMVKVESEGRTYRNTLFKE